MTTSQHPLANRYQLIRQLAAGSYAETWLATDLMLDRFVAIKLLHASDTDHQTETAQFFQEARIAAAVNHPNIVAIFDAGTTGDRPFLVMEWVDGSSLKREIVAARRLPVSRAVAVTAELLDGLSSIHEQGIIHRDVKPQNIMVNEFGTVKLADFGIARLAGESEVRGDGTTTGSAAYMAPEQAQGQPVTPAVDIYATGVILYEMLTGRLPFSHEDPRQVMLQHISDPVVPPRRINPAIPPQIESIVLQALEKDPYLRFQSAAEMRGALRGAWERVPVNPYITQLPVDEPSPWFAPRFAVMAASIALMVVMIAGATTLAVRDTGTSQAVSDAPAPTATTVPTQQPAAQPQPDPTSTEAPQEPQSAPQTAVNNDEYIVRGEVMIEGAPESTVSVNRPAPSRMATEDELIDDQDDTDSQTTASTQPQQPAPAPTQPPTPVPTEEPEPAAGEEQEDDGDEADPDQSGENSDDASGEPDETPAQGGEQSNDNGESEQTEGDESEDGSATGQGQNQGDDQPASGDDPVTNQSNDDDDQSEPADEQPETAEQQGSASSDGNNPDRNAGSPREQTLTVEEDRGEPAEEEPGQGDDDLVQESDQSDDQDDSDDNDDDEDEDEDEKQFNSVNTAQASGSPNSG